MTAKQYWRTYRENYLRMVGHIATVIFELGHRPMSEKDFEWANTQAEELTRLTLSFRTWDSQFRGNPNSELCYGERS